MKILRVGENIISPNCLKFSEEIRPLIGKLVAFRGCNERGPFRRGYLKGCDAETVTFCSGDCRPEDLEIWTYPIWEIMILEEQ